MRAPRVPSNEEARLHELWALNVLDTPPSERLDRITRVAAAALSVPMALISLVDQQRQWFKSRLGLSVPETSRDVSFCGHAVADDRLMIVPNAEVDERFCDNPLVTGPPDIRFYAGQVIHGPGGYPIGTLCVLDRKARDLSPEGVRLLTDLAALAEDEICASTLAAEWTSLRQTARFFEDLAENAGDLVQAVGPDGEIEYVNSTWRSVLDYVGQPAPSNIFAVIAPEEHRHCGEIFAEILRGGDAPRVETVFVSRAGTRIPVIGSVTRYSGPDHLHTRGVFRDARPDVVARNALRELAEIDALTGLPNRRVLDQRLTALVNLAVRYGRPLCVAFLDVDRFKAINDTHGHATGDRVLRRLADVLSANTRRSDVVARHGGEEFCVVLPDTADELAKELLDALQAKFRAAGEAPAEGPIATFSAGVACLSADRQTPEALLHAADVAMYRAKAAGRSRVIIADRDA